MKRRSFIALLAAATCLVGLLLIAAPSQSMNADQPPRNKCVAVSKQEYASADKQKVLHTRFSSFVTTGRVGQRHYWYCHS